MSEERAKVLQMVADGKISADEASRLLAALDEDEDRQDADQDAPAETPISPADMPRIGNLWLIPLYFGLVMFVCGALAVFPAYTASGSWLFVVCGWPVFLLGLLVMLAAWAARKSRWIHIRITNVDGSKRNIKLSFPLPLRLTGWAMKIGSRWVPKLKDSGVDETIAALSEELKGDQPLFIDVQEGDGGERVQVYIG